MFQVAVDILCVALAIFLLMRVYYWMKNKVKKGDQ
ncbi:MAG: hypothetical protein KCHDKBKB_02361 [Elusimicrobia bacterium]|nr:hypothetical protein [Elusimicrobiota bacterium]